jgi:Lrp/AsnC family leucine-responsive transcriptional regulator
MMHKNANPPQALDARDRHLLRLLQQDGRMTNAELAAALNMSESACLRRVKQLETSGLISRFAAVVEQRAAGFPLSVFVTVSLAAQSEESLKAFEQAVGGIPEVMECYLMTGSSDYLLRIVARDVDDLERIHATRLTRLDGVARINSSIALRAVVKRAALPL